MTYLCFVESDLQSVPHMEPLAAETAEAAALEARQVLARHTSGIAAHVFHHDLLIATIRDDEPPA